MCMSCGCEEYTERHPGSASIVWEQVREAAADAGITPVDAAENMLQGALHMMGKSAEDEIVVACEVVKSSSERRYTLGVAYPANRADQGVAADGFRDFAGPEVLEEAAWKFMRNGASIGLHHQDGTEGHGHVVESYIYRGPDWPQDNGYVVKAGDWLVGTVWDEPTWHAIKSGQLRGYSPQGSAKRRDPSPEALAALRS